MSCVLPEWKSTSSVSQGETPPPTTLNTWTIWWCSYTSDYANTSILHILLMSHAHKQCSRGGKKESRTHISDSLENQLGHTLSHPGRESERCPPLTEGQMDHPICCVPPCQKTRRHQTSRTWLWRHSGFLGFFCLWRPEHTLCHKCQLKRRKEKKKNWEHTAGKE